MKKARFMAAVAVSVIGVVAVPTTGAADTPSTLEVAIPTNVNVTVGETAIVFIGRPTSMSPVSCTTGTPQPQTVRSVDPASGTPAEITAVLAYHDHEIPLGSRYQVTAGPFTCTSELDLYTVESM